jgi:hypothetical protein
VVLEEIEADLPVTHYPGMPRRLADDVLGPFAEVLRAMRVDADGPVDERIPLDESSHLSEQDSSVPTVRTYSSPSSTQFLTTTSRSLSKSSISRWQWESTNMSVYNMKTVQGQGSEDREDRFRFQVPGFRK